MILAKFATFAFAALLAFGACASEEDASVVRVTRNIGGRPGFQVHWDIWKATFERQNPGWTLELIDLGNEDAGAYYRRAIATGDLPHVVMTLDYTKFLANGNHLLPIPRALYDRVGQNLPPLHNGQYYTAQVGRQITGIAVNKRIWAEAGITEPPQTWDAFIDALHKIKASGYKPLVYGGREWSAGVPLSYAIQTNLYDPTRPADEPSWTVRRDRGEITFATDPLMRPIMANMIALLDNFVEKGSLSDGYNEEQRDFFNEHAATWMMGCWMSGDVEPLQVDFEIEYWPIPSMTGHQPLFVNTSNQQRGWSMTSSAQGLYYDKALAVLNAYYHPEVYQAYLNAEGMLLNATQVEGVDGPKSTWGPTQRLFERMRTNLDHWGWTPGYFISIEDYPPTGFVLTLARVMQEIQAGNRDIDALLKMLDDDWEAGRKGNK